jgi:ABC-type cobalamin/Fe3+-siderophores transport system ATPase subunit
MILRSIEVKGWRCFPDNLRLSGFSERLNVVHGPNGVGKSTLFQAMVRACSITIVWEAKRPKHCDPGAANSRLR